MRLITDLSELGSCSCAVTIGKFDGIHAGHQLLIQAARREALAKGWKTAVVSFSVSPRKVLGEEARLLITQKEKLTILESLGVDYYIELPFTDEIRKMEAMDFVTSILLSRIRMQFLAIGEDFAFGYQRRGNCTLLKALSEKLHFQLAIYPKLKYNGRDISSSYIREEVKAGQMLSVSRMLGRSFSFCSPVLHGRALGRTIGFPTINLLPEPGRILPPSGVYFTLVGLENNRFFGLANLGNRPTVEGREIRLEVHLLDFSGDLYGKEAAVSLCHYHRPERKFDSLDRLMEQIKKDEDACRRYFQIMK